MRQTEYRGRFAPSPTGPLHMGSLLAAVASFLDARAAEGSWLLRIEDIDPPREVAGSSDSILRCLEAHGLLWDESVLYQSTRYAAYAEALESLTASGAVFSCSCTRATLGPGGSCLRRCGPDPDSPRSLRLSLGGDRSFSDIILGEQLPPGTASDLVLRRKDGLYAYALAVVVDDAWQQVSHVVRGHDLLDQTYAQLELFGQLQLSVPRYAHLPVLTDSAGSKLSKQTGATAVDTAQPLANLRQALRYLQQTSADLPAGSPQELLALATLHWDRAALANPPPGSLVYRDADSP